MSLPRSSLLLPLSLLGLGCARPAVQQPAPARPPAAVAVPATPAAGAPAASIAARTAGYQRLDGLIPVYHDARQGKLLLEIPHDSMRVLMFRMLATGLGSNPIGLDRGANGDADVTRFQRQGDRVLVIFENWRYRSSALDNADHQRTVAEAFPNSITAALPLLAAEDGRLLVDATDFVMRDWMDVGPTLARSQEGSYQPARDRSYIHEPYTKAFPRNTEIDVALTFATNGNPGRTVSGIAPDGRAITLRQHISFVALPDGSFRPREADPRVGYFGVSFKDYAQPVQGALDQRWASRHRLERVNPADPNSPIRNPIRYYIDRGIPEPMRSATLAGAKFWEEAFDAAGLRGGFVAELLPEGADPMDARYNVVQWVNRHERGWSIGGSLSDPRTGEILKGMARMDSHRARTSYNLYAGLMGAAASAADTAFVLGRVRQVTAHEIGHTLGMAHNYIASTYERGSVMDYPAPRVRVTPQGNIDLGAAYDLGPGPFDVWAIRWGYGIFPPASERDSLAAIVQDGLRNGLLFLSDGDARPDYASDPRTHLWDDAATATEFLQHQTAARRIAIDRFGLRNLRAGEPVALLQERFVPVYFMHRFAINALAKTIGGVQYSYAMVGDGQQATRPVPAREQRTALARITSLLAPQELAVPDTLITLLAPRPYGYGGSVELFGSRTRPIFDELGAARTLAQMIVDPVLQRDRAARLVQLAAHDAGALTLAETIDSLVGATWRRPAPSSAKLAALQRVTQRAVADALITLAADEQAAPEVRAMVDYKLAALRAEAGRRGASGSDASRAHWQAVARDVGRWLEDREVPATTTALRAPPGDPFGSDDEWLPLDASW